MNDEVENPFVVERIQNIILKNLTFKLSLKGQIGIVKAAFIGGKGILGKDYLEVWKAEDIS